MNQPIETDNQRRFDRVRVLVPGTGARFRCGGLSVALQTARLLSRVRPTDVVTYVEREFQYPFLDELLKQEESSDSVLWMVSWGFHVPKLLRRLQRHSVVYQAHSTGYGFDLPPGVPVVAVSRNTLGYWGNRAPRNPLFYVPNALEPHWLERGNRSSKTKTRGVRRPIDVLVQQRKSSPYVLNSLVPILRARGLIVEVQNGWVDDLVDLFNRSSVYLYDSAEYWRCMGLTEGFGLPPLEAMACGCVVFSSMNHALADTLMPGITAHQLGCGSLEFDVHRIIAAVNDPDQWHGSEVVIKQQLETSSESYCLNRWNYVLHQLEQGLPYWSDQNHLLSSPPIAIIRFRAFIQRFRKFLSSCFR